MVDRTISNDNNKTNIRGWGFRIMNRLLKLCTVYFSYTPFMRNADIDYVTDTFEPLCLIHHFYRALNRTPRDNTQCSSFVRGYVKTIFCDL